MKRSLTLLLVAALPALAADHSVALTFDRVAGRSQTLSSGGSSTTYKTDDFSALGIRGTAALAKFGPASLDLEGAYRFQGTADFTVTGTPQAYDYKVQTLSAGVSVNWSMVVDLGLGLDMRADRIVLSTGGGSQTYGGSTLRPWLKGRVGFTFPSPIVKPMVGLEASFALNNVSADANGTDLDKLIGSVAPKSTIGIYAGVRF